MQKPYFHFNRLVKKYSRNIKLYVQREGFYKGGIYHEGITDVFTVQGAFISTKRSSLNNSGGNYSKESKHLYTLSPIPHSLENVKVECEGQFYKITTDRDHGNEPFTGVYAYYLEWIQPFDNPDKECCHAVRY